MSTELSNAIQQIAEEKNLSVESIVETIELALAAAFRKDFGNKQQNVKVEFDLETGDSKVFDVKEVVDDELYEKYLQEKEQREGEEDEEANASTAKEVSRAAAQDGPGSTEAEAGELEDEEPRFNPKTMISLSQAKEAQTNIDLGDELKTQLEVPSDYGRMAAQTAKQVVIQKIREAEREMVFDTFKEKEHQLVNGMIQRVEPRVVLVDLDSATGIMPISEQIDGEYYRVGGRFKFYIKEVNQTSKGPEVIVSRAHPEVIRKLFAIEVPEIGTGSVVIKAIAREAGSRSKIAVLAKEENIDPIGSCVGQRGSRVQTIINELGGEKVDIIEYAEDATAFIANALSPAKVQRVETDEEQRLGRAFVKSDQLSLAIGKGGQNVRLAAKLTGWRIDVVDEDSGEVKESITNADEEPAESSEEPPAVDETDQEVPEAKESESSKEVTEAGEEGTEETQPEDGSTETDTTGQASEKNSNDNSPNK